MIGQTISHYKILDKLGEGGMGVVYKARDLKLEREVAIKFLPRHITINSEERERFKIEAKAAASLNHASITTIHSIEEDKDDVFIVMEYIDGIELKEKIKQGPIPVDEAINIAIQIAEGLEAAHKKEIIHRDIKSQNIMISGEGKVKIMDFGLAKIGGIQITKIGTTLGTAAYMSPEQARGDEVGQRTDIWSFGVVLYEMLSGRLPFKGDYEQAIIYSLLNVEPNPLTKYQIDIPKELQMIIDKTLQKDRDTRYQSVVELLTDLRSIQSGLGSTFTNFSFQKLDESKYKLPIQLTSFIGRENEIEKIIKLLLISRQITLTGPGGTGKTRLALQAAANMDTEFEHGIFFIALASINDPNVVPSAITKVLGINEIGGHSPLENLKQYLRNKQILLLLDNFEQIMDAAPVIIELLTSSPRLKIIVTSRAVLHISGEQEFFVPPLSLPDLKYQSSWKNFKQSEAVSLFIQRAKTVKPDFELDQENASAVSKICFQLDGLPLAIELAAARIKLLTPQSMLPKLENRFKLLIGGPRDVPARQQTLRGAIEWSYTLLDENEKKLLRRLSIFSGGFTLEAAEVVCNAISDLDLDILDGLGSLVDKSLVRKSEPSRFLLLETIREFGLECLINSGESEILHKTHRDYFLKFSEEAESNLRGSQQKKWLEKLDQDNDNLRAAFEWSLAETEIEYAFKLGATLWSYWLIRGYFHEGRKKLEKIIARIKPSISTEILAKVFTGAGTLAHNQGDYMMAQSFFEEGLLIYRNLSNKKGIAASLNNLGWIAWRLGNYTEAHILSEESLTLNREMEDNSGMATSMNNLGWIAHHQGNYSAACSFHNEVLKLFRKSGNKRNIAFAFNNLGWSMQKQGNYNQSLTMLNEALDIYKELGEKQLFAFALSILADLEYDNCNFEQAVKILEEQSIPIFREIGDKYGLAFALRVLGDVIYNLRNSQADEIHKESLSLRKDIKDKWGIAQSLHRLAGISIHYEDYNQAFSLYKESLSIRKEMEDKMGIVECIEGLGELNCRQNKLTCASQLLGAAKTLREIIGAPLSPCLLPSYERLVNTLQIGLEKQKFAEALTKGRDLPIEQTIAFALHEK